MKKILLLICFAFLIGSAYSQKWDQTFQSSTTNGPAVGVNAIVEFNGDMYVAGSWSSNLSTYVQKWDGSEWSVVGSGFSENLSSGAGIQALEVFNGDLYAAGYFTIDIGGTNHYSLIKLNTISGEWEAVTGFPSTTAGMRVYDLDQYNGNLMIGGKFYDLFGGADVVENIVGYNGTNWVPFNQGVWQGEVFTMDEHNSEFYIVGKFTQDRETNAYYDNMAKWDGSNGVWVNVSAFSTYTNSGYLSDIKSFGSHLYVYRYPDDIFNSYRTFMRWDLSAEITPINVVFSQAVTYPGKELKLLKDMIVYDGNLIVAGSYYSQVGNTGYPIQIESYDGTGWNQVLPGGVTANALGIYDGKLTTGSYSLQDPSMEFTADNTYPCSGESVTYSLTDYSSTPASSWTWTFEGGTPSTSNDVSPVVTYAANGDYNVSIEVTSVDGTNTVLKKNYIHIDNSVNITTQPVDVSICAGEDANFFIIQDFGNNFTQQWQVDDGSGYVDIDGATTTSLTTSASFDKNGFKYKCKITRCDNIVFSSEATLTVVESPTITTEPETQNICVSGDASFTVESDISSGTISYQWQYYIGPNNFGNLSDAGVYTGTNTKTLSITGADNTLSELYNAGTFAIYRCLVSANGCDLYSSTPRLNIYVAPTITAEPEDVTKCDIGNGVSTTFSVTASSGLGGYQWQVDDGSGFVDIVDDDIYTTSNSSTLTITNAPATYDGYQYRSQVGMCTPGVFSNSATFNIDVTPEITQAPVNTSICDGSDTEFTVEVSGGSSLSYQWQVSTANNNVYTDILVNDDTYFASDGTLQITAATTALNSYRYRCVISSGASCEITTGNGLLTIYSQPTLTSSTPPTNLTVCDGGSTILRVNPSSTNGIGSVFTYQWQVDAFDLGFVDLADDDNYSATTTKELSIDVAPFSFSGNKYRCVIKGCTTENISPEETLEVLQLPLITTSPESQTICSGEPVTFTAEATGSDLTYTWWVDTGNGTFTQQTSASTSPDYTFSATNATNGYKYKCVAQAGDCTASTAESFEATLSVQETQLTAVSAQSLQICAGETVKFGVEVSNLDGLTFQWSDGNGDLTEDAIYSGVTNDTLTITAPTTANNNYSVAITGPCGNTSISFSLLVFGLETPVIEAQLAGTPVLLVTTSFQLGVESFDWFLNGESYQNTGSSGSLTLEQAGSYTVVPSSNGCNYPESEAVVIIVTGFENKLSDNAINFYPNPVSNKLTLEMGNDFNLEASSRIVITNVNGKEVYNKNYSATSNRKTELDMSSYESGIYLMSIINGDNIIQYKIRKQ